MRGPARSERLTKAFFALKRAMHDRLKRSGAADPASMTRLAVLGLVRERGEATMKDVASFLCVTPPSATVLVDGIAAAGLLKRRHDAKDRRSVRLQLTPKGERSLAAGMRRVESVMTRMFAKLGPTEQDRLMESLEKLLV